MIWMLIYLAVAVWILLKIASKVHKYIKNSTYPYRKHWALALAQPMVEAQALRGFSTPDITELAKESKELLRTGLLHYLGFPPDISEEAAIQNICECYEATWFRIDLLSMQNKDDPRAAVAFACVRVAFFTRILMLQKWIDIDSGWRVLLLNAQRAQDCFSDWKDFGQQYKTGRRQWTALFRADPLGADLDDSRVKCFSTKQGPWALLPWASSAIFDPQEQSK